MSIASDLRTYADNAVTQGKQVFDQAQAQLNDVTGQANELYGKTRENVAGLASKATSTVNDLRVQAEKAVNLDAIKTAVEPYIIQVKGYVTPVTDRAESVLAGVKSDPRVAKLVDAARPVVETVQERVVKPVQDLTGRNSKPAAKPTAKAAPTKPVSKPAATKPVSKPAASKPAARKAPARRATR
jgi:DnaK suppressor protein